MRITGDAITLEAWVKVNSYRDGEWQHIILKSTSDDKGYDNGYFLRFNQSNLLQFRVAKSGDHCNVVHDQELPVGEWHHIAGTFDGNDCYIYINGIEVASATSDISNIGYSAYNLFIGDSSTEVGSAFLGSIDEVRISNIVRYDSNFTPEPSFEPDFGTAGLWHFSEGEGVATLDASENNNTGTLEGAEWVERE